MIRLAGRVAVQAPSAKHMRGARTDPRMSGAVWSQCGGVPRGQTLPGALNRRQEPSPKSGPLLLPDSHLGWMAGQIRLFVTEP